MEVIDLTEEPIYVTKGACPDCPLLPRSSTKVTPEMWQRSRAWLLEHARMLECTSVTLARHQGKRLPPDICCYAFFYQYWQDIPELSQAVEQQRIRYLDITGWLTLSESHYRINNPEQPLTTDHWYLPMCSVKEWEEHGDK